MDEALFDMFYVEPKRGPGIGFTGPRTGMTTEQAVEVFGVLKTCVEDTVALAHMGDCLGADVEFHEMARACRCVLVGHPPVEERMRAFLEYDEELPPQPYLTRNLHIVRDSEILIAAVPGPEVLRSGTWSTVRYARRAKKRRFLVWPDGAVSTR